MNLKILAIFCFFFLARAQNCDKEVSDHLNCMKLIQNRQDSDQESGNSMKKKLQNETDAEIQKCFRDSGCEIPDPFDADTSGFQICANEASGSLRSNFQICLKSKGDENFQAADGIKFLQINENQQKNHGSADLRAGIEKCSKEKKVDKNVLMRCIAENSQKAQKNQNFLQQIFSAQNFFQGASGLGQANDLFQKYCGAKRDCDAKLSQGCRQKICDCHQEVRKNLDDTKQKFDKCVKDSGVANSERQRQFADGFQTVIPSFCTGDDSKNVCDAQSLPDLIAGKLMGGASGAAGASGTTGNDQNGGGQQTTQKPGNLWNQFGNQFGNVFGNQFGK